MNPVGEMETITLSNGVEMSALGLGVFQTPPEETRDAVQAALASEIDVDPGLRLADELRWEQVAAEARGPGDRTTR